LRRARHSARPSRARTEHLARPRSRASCRARLQCTSTSAETNAKEPEARRLDPDPSAAARWSVRRLRPDGRPDPGRCLRGPAPASAGDRFDDRPRRRPGGAGASRRGAAGTHRHGNAAGRAEPLIGGRRRAPLPGDGDTARLPGTFDAAGRYVLTVGCGARSAGLRVADRTGRSKVRVWPRHDSRSGRAARFRPVCNPCRLVATA